MTRRNLIDEPYWSAHFIGNMGTAFFLYTFAILLVGLLSARSHTKSSADFFLAGRRLGAWVGALSACASAESGWVMMGLVGSAFKIGVATFWIVPGTIAAFLFNWLVFAKKMQKASNAGAITVTDVIAQPHQGNFQKVIRLACVGVLLFFLVAYVSAQLSAAGKLFEASFQWSYSSGVLVGAAIVLAYTVVGGFRAVAWTDVAQAFLMFFSLIVLPLLLVNHLGGFGALWAALGNQQGGNALTHPLAAKVGLGAIGFLSVWIGIPVGNIGQPHVLVRFMAIEDRKALRRAATISVIWVTLLFSGAVLLGLAGRAYYHTLLDPEKVLPLVAAELLPSALSGLVLAGVLAAICSTADSQLLVAASSISHDIYVRFLKQKPDVNIQARINRLTVLVLGTLALFIALLEVRVIFDFVLYAWAGLGVFFGGTLVLRFYRPDTSSIAILVAMTASLIAVIVGRQLFEGAFYELIPGVGCVSCCHNRRVLR